MTVDQYRGFSKEEREDLLIYIKDYEFETPEFDPATFTQDMLSIDWYYRQRFKEREKKPDISWPSKLSKKEEVHCKLSMMQNLLETSYRTASTPENATFINGLLIFIKSAIKEVYKHKSSIDGPKFRGIPEDVAQVINAFYPNLIKSFRKKFAV